MVYWDSGYALMTSMAGNLLLEARALRAGNSKQNQVIVAVSHTLLDNMANSSQAEMIGSTKIGLEMTLRGTLVHFLPEDKIQSP